MRNLRDVRIELQARLGFGAADQPQLTPILNSFLREAQDQLYEVGTFKDLSSYWDITATTGSTNIAYPTTDGGLNPDKITDVKVDLGNGSPSWQDVREGIRAEDYNYSVASSPVRYERRSDGFEFIPERDQDYTIRVHGMRKLGALRDDGDLFDIDDAMVFIVALASAKQHYRHPDAETYLGKAGAVLAAVKWNNVGPKLIRPADKDDYEVEPRPVVI